jgi:hypothetical protein
LNRKALSHILYYAWWGGGGRGGTTKEKEGKRGDRGRGGYNRTVLRHSERIYVHSTIGNLKYGTYASDFSQPANYWWRLKQALQ